MNPTPTGLLQVLQPGVGTTVQDGGRLGHRHQGLPCSGWLDAPLAEAANALVGNGGAEAVLELRGQGTECLVQAGPVRVALTGAVTAQCLGIDGSLRTLPAWQSATLQVGDRLRLGLAETGCAYLAMSGGCRLPLLLGSRSSYGRAGLPGVQGRPLRPGDLLPCTAQDPANPGEWQMPTPWMPAPGPIRVLLGPQDDHFNAAALDHLLTEEWVSTPEQDRMGLRLLGPALTHRTAAAAEIVSDGVTPGAIQVPASGQPIVLLADCQTVGGYPKIATVVTADLPRLAHCPPGTRLRFQAVDQAQAHRALLARHTAWQQWCRTRRRLAPTGGIDEAALLSCNLVSGLMRAEP
jgi:5-oxoprolinase (ATP-hydrolysing) subunit C